MTPQQIHKADTLKIMLDSIKDESSIGDFIKQASSEIRVIKKYIKQAQLASNLINKHFNFIASDNDKKQIIKITNTFPELRTPRQIEITFNMLNGLSGKEIAEKMNLSEKCVKFHKTKVFRLTETKSTSELMAYFYKDKENDFLPKGI